MNNSSSRIALWRNTPPQCSTIGARQPDSEFVFPSGRKALAFAVRMAGLTRHDRIALPEWSSHCVVNAVGWHATPVPMREALEFKIPVQAVLVYEQWGWPFCRSAYLELQERFGCAAIIWDRVDSAHFSSPIGYELASSSFEIVSLSKLLGLHGGGLCRQCGKLIQAPRTPVSPITAACLRFDTELLNTFGCKEYFKSDSEVPHPAVTDWIATNDIASALEKEKQHRIAHLRIVRRHPLACDWPEWMQEALRVGAAPGIVPLLRRAPPSILQRAVATLASACAIESSLHHFDWSGNPLSPSYEPCLAVPVHGQVDSLPEILQTLENISGEARRLPFDRTKRRGLSSS
jgi:hypothetical protein